MSTKTAVDAVHTAISNMSWADVSAYSVPEVQALLGVHYSGGGDTTPFIDELTTRFVGLSVLVNNLTLFEVCDCISLPFKEGRRLFRMYVYSEVCRQKISLESPKAGDILHRLDLIVKSATAEHALRCQIEGMGRKSEELARARLQIAQNLALQKELRVSLGSLLGINSRKK